MRSSFSSVVWVLLLSAAPVCGQGIITTVAGNGQMGFSGDGGPATAASLIYPTGVALDAAGNLYIADHGDNRIRKVSPSGTISTVAGNGAKAFSGNGGAATNAGMGPYGVAVDAAGNLYIGDDYNNRIRKVSPGGTISTVAGDGAEGFSGDGGPATAASLRWPTAVAVDAAGNLYIADNWNYRVRKVSPSGTISTVAGDGREGFSGDGGPATRASLSSPSGVAVDAAGNLYIADYWNSRVRKVNPSGTISTMAGNGVKAFGGDGGPASAASLVTPCGVAVDAAGSLYIADCGPSVIRKVSPSGIITTVAGNGTSAFSGDGGPATSASLYVPAAVAVDAAGNLYIADDDNHRVRKVAPACSYAISPASATAAAAGGSSSVAVTAPTGCTWTAASDASWITITSGSSGSGTGTVTYKVAPNTSTSTLTGTLTIAGQTFTVTQVGATCSFTISPTSASVAAVGGNGSVSVTASSACSWTARSDATWITIASGASGSGNGTVGYSVAPNAGGAARTGTLTIGGQSFTVNQAVASGPILFSGGVVNAASFAPAPAPVAPGSLVSIFGIGLAAATTSAAAVPLPTSLSGTQVLMNGIAAPLIFVSPGQINAQVPWEISGGSISTQVVANGALSNTVTAASGPAAPGVFTMDQSGSGQGAVLIAAVGHLAAASGSVTGCLSRPVLPGEHISIYCTGLGAVSNPPSSGAPAPSEQLSTTMSTPTVTIGGIPATVVFSGLAPGFVGLYQVNVRVPANVPSGNAVPVVLGIGGASAKPVTLASTGSSTSSAVSVTDSNGAATVTSGGVSIPVALSDPMTGNPIRGANVALGLPPSGQGLATLFVTDPQGRYPTRFLTLTAPKGRAPTAAGAARQMVSDGGAADAIPVSVPLGSNCPSSLPGTTTVQPSIDSIYVPGPPPPSLLDAMRDAELSALNSYASSYGLNISLRDRQIGFASRSDCAQQIWEWIRPEAVSAGKLWLALKAVEYASGVELALAPVDVLHAIVDTDVPKMSSALKVCESWVSGAAVRAIDLGNQRLLSVVLSGQPGPNNVVSQPVSTRNAQNQPVPSSVCYVSGDTLGGDFAASTDASGNTVMNIPPDDYTAAITAPGYTPITQNVTTPAQGQAAPLAASLAPNPQGPYSLVVTKTGDGAGSVTSDAGITCGSRCWATYAAGTIVRLTATPLTGSTFTGWSGGACSGTGACSVTMDGNKTVTANFTSAPPAGPLVFTVPATLPPATVGVPYKYSFCVPEPATPTSACGPMPPTTNPTGGSPPYHFQLGSGVGFPPMGISLGKDGQLTGTPTAAGTSTFQVCAIDLSANSVCQTVSLTVSAAVTGTYTAHMGATVTSNSLICGHGNTTMAVDFQLRITGGQGTSASPFTGSFSGRGTETDLFYYRSVCNGTYPFNVLSSTVGGSSGQIAVAGMIGMSLGTDHQAFTFTSSNIGSNSIIGTLTVDNMDLTPVSGPFKYFDAPYVATVTFTKSP